MDTNSKNDIEENENSSDAQKEKDEQQVIQNNSNVEMDEKENTEILDYKENLINEEEGTQKVIPKTEKKHSKVMNYSIVTFLFLLIFSMISVYSYVPIRNEVFKNHDVTEEYLESEDFSYNLLRYTKSILYSLNSDDKDYYNRYEDAKSIIYYATNNNNQLCISNNETMTKEIKQNKIKDSQFYLFLKSDDQGLFSIETITNEKFDKNRFLNDLNLNNEDDKYANFSIEYIIPKDLTGYEDKFIYDFKNYNFEKYIILILIIGVVGVIILSIIALMMSYSSQSKKKMCRLYNVLPLEFKAFIFGGIAIAVDCLSYSDFYNFNVVDMVCNVDFNFHIIGILVTFMVYLFVYINIVYLKSIYHKGILNGFIKNSIIGKISAILVIKILKTVKNFFNLEKNMHIKLIIILAINFVVLCAIAIPFNYMYGITIAVLYSILLFMFLLRFLMKIKKLNEASNQLASGKFDLEYNEDMGIFKPVFENFNNINKGFIVAIDEATKSQQMKTELISNVSHDLKTPLTSIITYVDLLKNDEIDDKTQKKYIEILDKKSKRLKVLIEDLFEASKANSGNIELCLENVDVIALFRQTLGELEEKMNESSLDFKINLPIDKAICELDGRKTFRIFENIMSNIFKYSMNNSRVYIDVEENDKQISFIFRNISAYEMNFNSEEIIDRFTRGDKSRNTEGSGLGLAITKSFVEIQKGNLEIIIDGDLFKLIVTFPKNLA
ncbi:sensor histidine kinase [Abyssisolibacter fermentans]|uniref:sensor histidine kinase n=1 Tax=Abyssisolibacter fermentans TaxID=1766203 RepID=UPI00082A6CD5|nr:HAMP domain-containing sensor histidine kinase [Abyssisolibacter fermentans]